MDINQILTINPKVSVVLASALVTLGMTLVTKHFTNQNRIKELKKIQNTCKIQIKEHKNDKEKLAAIQKQMLECNLEMMNHSMKPMLFTFLPLILLIGWLRGIFTHTDIASTWIWWYIGAGIVSSMIFRKIFNVA